MVELKDADKADMKRLKQKVVHLLPFLSYDRYC